MKKKIILCFLIFLFINISSSFVKESLGRKDLPRLLFFYSQTCHSCSKTKNEIMPAIDKEFFDKIIIEYLDIADINNYKLMLSLKEKYKCFEDGVPTIFIEGKILVGYEQIKDKLRNTIISVLKEGRIEFFDRLPGIDLVKHFFSFGVFTIILAGLIDGINPCAFTVIVFFISFLAFQGYKKKELAIIGLSFIFAVFLTYVLIGLGAFRFLYSLSKFYLVTKIVYYLIAIFCFVIGFFAIYDLWLFKKTGKTEGMSLQLPQAIKNRIHYIIGLHYRKPREEGQVAPKRHFLRLIISAFVTGFLVSLLEAVCTGQVYLPTIAFLLKDVFLRMRAFTYLVLYNLMFIFPLFIIFVLVLFGATSESFAKFLKRHMLAIKLSMAVLFFGLGILLLIGA